MGEGGGGGTLIFSYIQRLRYFLFNILNFNIFGGFQKTEYFYIFGYEDFVDIFGVITNFSFWSLF